MRVAMLLSNAFRPDPRVLKEARTLARAGYWVDVVAWDREGAFPPEESVEGFTVRRIAAVRSRYGAGWVQIVRLPRFWLEACRRLAALRPDVVHCHDFDTLIPGLLWRRKHGVPVVYDAHDDYAAMQAPRLRGWSGAALRRIIDAAERRLAARADAVITVDEHLARRYPVARTTVLGHYPPAAFGATARPDPAAEPSLVYSGRLSTDRGLLVIAAALHALAAEGQRPRLRLLGTWTSPGERSAFESAMEGLEGQLDFRGWVPFSEVAAHLAGAHVALSTLLPVPRYVAALPVKLFEYMACGLPVVASDFPSVRRVVEAAGCGILVDPTDAGALAAAIRVLLTDRALARRLGEQGAAAFRACYNWEAIEPDLLGVYARVRSS
ncbi:MAG: glycosyltransferase [Acidobacteria bacterium]|nr:glycosyltransferase [Acidobacteriota bacterium]